MCIERSSGVDTVLYKTYHFYTRNMGMWISGGLHNLICKTSNCYNPTMVCKCKLCGLGADQLRHLEEWTGAADCQIIIK